MSYSTQAMMSVDGDFIARVAACAAIEVAKTHQPQQWATDHVWWIAASPGFADSYEYALNTDPPVARPGNDPAVITDAQILTSVQGLIAELEA